MRAIWLMAKKDLLIYFRSPLAYVIMACFLFIAGYFFVSMAGNYQLVSIQVMQNPQAQGFTPFEWIIRPFLQNSAVILLFFLPLLTMRSFAEEKRMGTFELLLTYPVREFHMALGKLAALSLFLFLLLFLSATGPILLFFYAEPEILPMLIGYLGLFLLAVSFASLGLFLSSLTENQVVAGSLSFGMLLLLWLLSWMKDLLSGPAAMVIGHLSILNWFEEFAKGVFSLAGLTFYLTFTLFFLWLTSLSLENQRWRI